MKNKVELVVLLIVLVLAAYFRLNDISGYMTFLGDEGRDVLVVKRMIVDHKFTLLGPTASVGGFFLGPVYYYFMAPFLWLWRMDPTGPAVMVALFGVATVYLVYRFGKDIFGTLSGLSAALLYALSPVVIAYSRSSWNPNLVPFFSTALVYCLYRTVVKNQWNLLFVIGVIFGIGMQLHYLFSFLFIVTGIWFWIYGKSKTHIRHYIYGAIGFAVGYAPFLLFEVRHSFPNTTSIVQFLLSGKETGFSILEFIQIVRDVSFRLFGRLLFRLPQPELWGTFPQWQQMIWWLATRGLLVLSLVSLVRLRKRQESVLLLIWLVVVIVLFGFYRRGIYDYYFGIFFALPFLLLGWVFSEFWKNERTKWIAAVLFIVIAIVNWEGRPFKFPPNNQLAQMRKIAEVAYAKTDGKPFNFALVAPLNSDHAYRYFFEIWGNIPVTIENAAKDPDRRTVTDQLIVICEISNCQPLGNPLWEIAGFGRAEISGLWEVPFVTIYKLTHYREQQ